MVSGIYGLGFFAGGVANAVYASDNADDYDDIEASCDRDGNPQQFEDICDNLRTVRNSEGAAAVSLMSIYSNNYFIQWNHYFFL